MTSIAWTESGPVSGTNSTLVEAAAAIVAAVPSPATSPEVRIDDLVSAVRIPWARVPISG